MYKAGCLEASKSYYQYFVAYLKLYWAVNCLHIYRLWIVNQISYDHKVTPPRASGKSPAEFLQNTLTW